MSVFAAAARYSRALDERARHDRRDGAVICIVMAIGLLVISAVLAL
jgi:uncharacterized membrane protein YidH (DUF202 family)